MEGRPQLVVSIIKAAGQGRSHTQRRKLVVCVTIRKSLTRITVNNKSDSFIPMGNNTIALVITGTVLPYGTFAL